MSQGQLTYSRAGAWHAADPKLFTPGPLTTSRSVKGAMNRDLGAWDQSLIDLAAALRGKLLQVAEVTRTGGWECVLMQGSGTFGVESAIGSFVPRGGRLLVAVNGAYGERMVRIARTLGIETTRLAFDPTVPVEPTAVAHALIEQPEITDVAVVHCETTTGLMNPIEQIGQRVREFGRRLLVDAMSSFGAVPIDLEQACVDVLVSSANKCLEGVPGISVVLVRRSILESSRGTARSVSLDLVDQWEQFEAHGRFRFTPPTHVLLALDRALDELAQEGGVVARQRRYLANRDRLLTHTRAVGLRELLLPEQLSCIITSFLDPEHPAYSFQEFYSRLAERGQVIYPGKLTRTDCFRIGHIGHLHLCDIDVLGHHLRAVLDEMGVLA